MADKDGDLIATKEEFTAFLHPEEYDYMKDIVVQVGEARVPAATAAAQLLLCPCAYSALCLHRAWLCSGRTLKLRSIAAFLQYPRFIITLSIK